MFFRNNPDDFIDMGEDYKSKYKTLRKGLWQLSYPTMIAFGLQSFYDIVDMAWVGQISSSALSGVTLFSTIFMLFTVLNEIAGSGSVAMIAQAYGRGDEEKTRIISEQTISFKIILALISAGALLLFLKPILNFYTDDQSVVEAALEYGYIRIFFLPMMFASYSVNTIFRCTDDSKTPMKIMLIAGFLNLVLDPIMMFDRIPGLGLPGMGMGVFGAALATAISTTVSFLYGFSILLSGRKGQTISIKGLFRLNADIDRELLTVGFPSGIQLFIRQFFNATMMKFVTVYGTQAVALAGISGKLNAFMLMPIFGLNMAGSTMVGNALGREKIKDAELVSKIAIEMNLAVVGGISFLVVVLASYIMSFFSNEPYVISQGMIMIRISALALMMVAYNFGKKTVFSGSGFNRPQLVATFVSKWIMQLPAMYLIVYGFKLPLSYFWLSMLVAEIGDLFITEYYYGQDTWRLNRV